MRRIRTFAEALPFLLLLSISLLGAVVVSLAVGQGTLLLDWLSGKLNETGAIILWDLRLPRVLTAILVGAALSVSGAAVQGLFRNPLTSPDVLGVSAGAATGALALLVVFGLPWGQGTLALGAFVGALVTVGAVFLVGTSRRSTDLLSVLLAGLAFSSLLNGFSALLLTFSKDAQLSSYLFWIMGSLENRRWEHFFTALPVIVPSLIGLFASSGGLNVLSLGEDVASSLGLRIQRQKTITLVLAVMATSAAVSVSGAIGFIALLIPHTVRLLWGNDARWLLPLSALFGALFLVLADLFARTIVQPFEIPVGILTAILGSPYFLFLLFRRRKKEGAKL